MAPWDAGCGGAGVKDGPRNSAWQCSEFSEKHCPRLVDVHTGQCVHKERWETIQEGRETKASGEKGIQAGMTAFQQPQRPSPEQPKLASLQNPTAYGGLFSEPQLSGGEGAGGTPLLQGTRTSPARDRNGVARGLSPDISAVAKTSRQTRSQQSDQRQRARKLAGGQGTLASPGE